MSHTSLSTSVASTQMTPVIPTAVGRNSYVIHTITTSVNISRTYRVAMRNMTMHLDNLQRAGIPTASGGTVTQLTPGVAMIIGEAIRETLRRNTPTKKYEFIDETNAVASEYKVVKPRTLQPPGAPRKNRSAFRRTVPADVCRRLFQD